LDSIEVRRTAGHARMPHFKPLAPVAPTTDGVAIVYQLTLCLTCRRPGQR
jgi:hypothetical protein